MKQDLQLPRGVIDGMEAFLRVAARRSFSAAAADLGVSPSAISQAIRALEDRVGTPLFMRTTRSVGLTQAGELFHAGAAPAYDGLAAAFEAARNLGERPAGRLRINLSRAVIPHLFEPILADFCDTYPEIELDIVAEDGLIDLTAGGFDAGVRLGEMVAQDMVAIRLSGSFRFVAAAAPAYTARFGRPAHPSDLAGHRCIRVRLRSGALMPWSFVDGNRAIDVAVKGPVIVNDHAALMMALREGVGIAYVAEPNVATMVEAGAVEVLLPDHAVSSSGLFLYYPERRQVMPKLRAFIDFVRANLDLISEPAPARGGNSPA
jgi:DNA-binding transcriptional LysR family regulator